MDDTAIALTDRMESMPELVSARERLGRTNVGTTVTFLGTREEL